MRKVLYIIDDINYNSGAKAVTLLQMKMLQKDYDISLLTLTEPQEDIPFLNREHILEQYIWKITEIYAVSFKKVLKERSYSLLQKISRFFYALSLRCGLGDVYFDKLIRKRLKPILETFDIVIVVSEASKLRKLVSELTYPKKIQWIHTDYIRWCEFSEWSRSITSCDANIYPKYDSIVVLSNYCKKGMLKKVPDISEKIIVIPNLIDGAHILKLSKEVCHIDIDADKLNLVTVARLDREKGIDRVLELAAEMKRKHIAFMWYIIGDGPEQIRLEEKKKKLVLDDCVKFLGYLENPYPIMARCDSLVLLSKYEGTPVTIDEAMVLGVGVIAPDVGGIKEQMALYDCGQVYEKIDVDTLLKNHTGKNSQICYEKNNLDVINKIVKLF